jgi:dipeptidyl aminopeptidase/acylaminoacyl peptidase
MIHFEHQLQIALVFICLLIPASLFGQQVTVDDYERANELRDQFQGKVLNVVDDPTWIKDTSHLWYRKTVEGGHRFIWVDAENQQKRDAFDHEQLAEALSASSDSEYEALELPFEEIKYVNNESAIEVEVGDSLYTCNLSSYTCEGEPEEDGNQWGGWNPWQNNNDGNQNDEEVSSPNDEWVAFVQNYNVAVRKKGSDETIMLSTDGSEGNYYDADSFEWSPDSKKLVAYRVKPGYDRQVHYVESSPDDQLQPKHRQRSYAKPGDVLDEEQPVLFDVESQEQTTIDRSSFPNAYNISDAEWWEDSRAFRIEYNQRGHKVYKVLEVDGETGEVRTLIHEEPPEFFAYSQTLFRHYSDNGEEIIWASERDGWRHLYLYDGKTGEVKNQITEGDWVVREVDSVDTEKRQIWFRASGVDADQDPYFHHYFRVNFDGSGLTRFTEADGNHDVAYSKDREYYVDVWSRVDQAPVAQLKRTSNQEVIMELERGDLAPLEEEGWQAPEPFVAKGRDGETDIWGVIVRPTDFDPNKNYPVIEYIYAGPHDSFVPKSFSSYHHMMSLAELGFIVVQIDGMGTDNRSKEFHNVAWKNIKDAGFPDRILWHKAAAEEYDYYDISKVGIYGTSAGGQSSMGALLFHPDFYKVAVSASGCHDNRMDKIWWNEQWMGWPIDEHYSESSNVDNAWRLQGDLLLIVGELDTNVDPASTYQVANALIEANKHFELFTVPGGGHTSGGELGERMRRDFFVEHIHGIDPPHWNSLSVTNKEQEITTTR